MMVGRAAKYRILCEDSSNKLIIEKLILSKEDLSKSGFSVIRVTKWGTLYRQLMSIRYNSLANICLSVFKPTIIIDQPENF